MAYKNNKKPLFFKGKNRTDFQSKKNKNALKRKKIVFP